MAKPELRPHPVSVRAELARLLPFLLATAVGCFGAAPESGQARLRQLIQLPMIHAALGVSVNTTVGFHFESASGDLEVGAVHAELEALTRQLNGTSADAARYGRLGELYSKCNDSTNATSANAKAAELYRKRVEQQPEDGRLLAAFGEVLRRAGEPTEAESRLRQAVRIVPNAWECWTSLGRLQDDRAAGVLGGFTTSHRSEQKGALNLMADLPNQPPTGSELAEATRWFAEAQASFDRAVALAPEKPEVHIARSVHFFCQNLVMAFRKSRAKWTSASGGSSLATHFRTFGRPPG